MMQPVTVLKLGGSAITDKSKDCKPNVEIIHACADEIAKFKGNLILLHGAGSYAHPLAMRSQIQSGYRARNQLFDLSQIELQLEELSRIIGVSLLLKRIPFAPIRPMSFLSLTSGKINNGFTRPITTALKLGVTPLIHGDVVFDTVRGFGIVSADRIASFLAREMNVSRVLFGSDVDGIFTEDPKKSNNGHLLTEIKRENFRGVLNKLRTSSNTDASQGMFGKVTEAIQLARMGCKVYFFNVKNRKVLRNVLIERGFVGTRILPLKSK